MEVTQEQLNPDGVRGHMAAAISAVHCILYHIGATEFQTETLPIVEGLRRGEKVELRGFGSFRLRRREPRRGRNPKTGGRVDVASKHVAYFTPGKELKELINRDPAQPVPPPLAE